MYHELGEEWVPNPRNKLFEKEENLFKKMTEVRVYICILYGIIFDRENIDIDVKL